MDGTRTLNVKLALNDLSLSVLEELAAAQRATIDELVMGLVRKAIRSEEKARRLKANGPDEAPLDAFLPAGTDPFEPVGHRESGLASSFADVQTRMRFAGTPGLFRGLE